MPKYHTAIGVPENCDRMTGRFRLEPTAHAEERSDTHKYAPFDLPSGITIREQMYERDPFEATGPNRTAQHVFEVCVEHGRVHKVAVRYEYDSDFDQSVVVCRDGTLVTAWLNYRDDDHDTLDRTEYAQP